MKKYRYFILSVAIIIADQATKLAVVRNIPMNTAAWSLWGDFFNLIHVRNTGVAFSMGSGLPEIFRIVLFIAVPIIILIGVGFYVVRGTDLTNGQKWVLAGIIGGGMGNQIDRIFRPEGVVDFMDFKFYGLFGLERWPTFNISDASLVVSAILLIIMLVVQEVRLKKEAKS